MRTQKLLSQAVAFALAQAIVGAVMPVSAGDLSLVAAAKANPPIERPFQSGTPPHRAADATPVLHKIMLRALERYMAESGLAHHRELEPEFLDLRIEFEFGARDAETSEAVFFSGDCGLGLSNESIVGELCCIITEHPSARGAIDVLRRSRLPPAFRQVCVDVPVFMGYFR